jgi:hypothetical protein
MCLHIGHLLCSYVLCSTGTVPCTFFQQDDHDRSRMDIISAACTTSLLVTVAESGYVVLRAKCACVLRQTEICGVWRVKVINFGSLLHVLLTVVIFYLLGKGKK